MSEYEKLRWKVEESYGHIIAFDYDKGGTFAFWSFQRNPRTGQVDEEKVPPQILFLLQLKKAEELNEKLTEALARTQSEKLPSPEECDRELDEVERLHRERGKQP
jgi:hypothetical protein